MSPWCSASAKKNSSRRCAENWKITTPFCRWALASGARQAWDGLGMLVEQAALAFELWRGVLPDTVGVLRELRAEIGQSRPGEDS